MASSIPAQSGAVAGGVRTVLRVEGAAVLTAALLAYHFLHGSWLWFALFFLAPDLSFVAYALNRSAATAAYNTAHSYIGPIALFLLGYASKPHLQALSLIWFAHVGFDRMLGYGLKYSTAFQHTHLGLIGGKTR